MPGITKSITSPIRVSQHRFVAIVATEDFRECEIQADYVRTNIDYSDGCREERRIPEIDEFENVTIRERVFSRLSWILFRYAKSPVISVKTAFFSFQFPIGILGACRNKILLAR